MKRCNLITIDSSKDVEFFRVGNIICLNCNSYFRRIDSIKIKEIDKNFLKNVEKLNLCNFASLCYKLKIIYSSFEALELMTSIVNSIQACNPNIQLVQEKILKNMEVDSCPLENLLKIKDNEITINKILKDLLKFIGFTDSQITNLCSTYKNIEKIVPRDLMERVPMSSDLTNMTYSILKEAMDA